MVTLSPVAFDVPIEKPKNTKMIQVTTYVVIWNWGLSQWEPSWRVVFALKTTFLFYYELDNRSTFWFIKFCVKINIPFIQQ